MNTILEEPIAVDELSKPVQFASTTLKITQSTQFAFNMNYVIFRTSLQHLKSISFIKIFVSYFYRYYDALRPCSYVHEHFVFCWSFYLLIFFLFYSLLNKPSNKHNIFMDYICIYTQLTIDL